MHLLVSIFHFHHPHSDTYPACMIAKSPNLFLHAPIHLPICHSNFLLKATSDCFSPLLSWTTQLHTKWHKIAPTFPTGPLCYPLHRLCCSFSSFCAFSSNLCLKCDSFFTWKTPLCPSQPHLNDFSSVKSFQTFPIKIVLAVTLNLL